MGNWLMTELRFLGITLLTGSCYGYLAQKFMGQARAGRWVGITYTASAAALYYLLPVYSNFTAYCFLALTGFLVMYGPERENAAQKLLLSVTFFSLRWLYRSPPRSRKQRRRYGSHSRSWKSALVPL